MAIVDRPIRVERVDHDELARRHRIGALILVGVFFFFCFFSPTLMCNASVLQQEFVAGKFLRPLASMFSFF